MSPIIIAIGKDQMLNYALCELLKTRELHCEPYLAGSITHEELVKLSPDLVLLDVNHEKDFSLDILAAIRRDQRLKRSKVMVLTIEGCSHLRALHLADHILIKPCRIDELEAKVRHALANPSRQTE